MAAEGKSGEPLAGRFAVELGRLRADMAGDGDAVKGIWAAVNVTSLGVVDDAFWWANAAPETGSVFTKVRIDGQHMRRPGTPTTRAPGVRSFPAADPGRSPLSPPSRSPALPTTLTFTSYVVPSS